MEEYIGLKELADIIGVSKPTVVKKLIDRSWSLPYARFGRDYRFKREDVAAFINMSFNTLPKNIVCKPRPRKKK